MLTSAPIQKDSYKIDHINQYPSGTTEIYSNLTARSGTHSNVPTDGVVFVGLQYFCLDYLIDEWNQSFFTKPKDAVVGRYKRIVESIIDKPVDVSHLEQLHDLGYLPLIIKALPEGSFVPYRVPLLTIKNTLPEFYWLTNMVECVLSNELWPMITSATTYNAYRRLFVKYAEATGAPKEFIPYQGHDFSYRGMFGRHAGAMSGGAVLLAGGGGTDNIPGIDFVETFYSADIDKEIVGKSVPASEHSVVTSYGAENELETLRHLLTDVYPTGIFSYVADSWDFWKLVSEYLPQLKDVIMSREGKTVCRPDSGCPVEILCGMDIQTIKADTKEIFESNCETLFANYVAEHNLFYVGNNASEQLLVRWNDTVYKVATSLIWNFRKERYEYGFITITPELLTPPQKGLIECLWDIFGGSVNDAGFKVLDSHIGAIYGDSITYERADKILGRLANKGFASNNIVLGIGSYTYTHVTRDTHGIAVKSTHAIINGKGVDIFKDPKTDSGTKKSAKGYLMVTQTDGVYGLVDQVTSTQEQHGCLETVFKDGKLIKCQRLSEIRARAMSN